MLNFTTALIVYSIELLIAYSVFSSISEKRYHTAIVLLIGALIFACGAAVNVLFANSAWINLIFTLIINFIFAYSCFRFSISAALFYAVLLDFFSAVFEIITALFISKFLGIDLNDYNKSIAILVLEVTISKSLYFMISLVILRMSREHNRMIIPIPASLYIYPLCTLLCCVYFWRICVFEGISEKNQLQFAYLSAALLISTIVLFITYQRNLEKENEYIQAKTELEGLETEKEYYEVLEHQNRQLMIYAHDAKNHLTAIQSLSGDPSIHEYVEELAAQLKSYTRTSHSGNKILDVMISRYSAECEMRKIRFEYDVKACNFSGMEDIDVVAVLGNLMDNALIAAEQSEKKFLSLETTWRNTYSVLIVSNSCDREPISKGGQLITTKKENRLHGYGLRSVKRTLRKYQGDYTWEYDAGKHLFIVTAMIGEKIL